MQFAIYVKPEVLANHNALEAFLSAVGALPHAERVQKLFEAHPNSELNRVFILYCENEDSKVQTLVSALPGVERCDLLAPRFHGSVFGS